jgi:hypothetical protein
VYLHLEQKRKGLSPHPVDIYSNVRSSSSPLASLCPPLSLVPAAEHRPRCCVPQRYASYKECLVKAERELLKELGFILYTEHPHKLILNYVKLLTADDAALKRLAQYAWNFINDSLRTDVCIRYAPEVICCAAVWMGARVLQIKLPSNTSPPWWEIFDTRKEDLDAVCTQVAALYSRARARYIELRPAAPVLAPPPPV